MIFSSPSTRDLAVSNSDSYSASRPSESANEISLPSNTVPDFATNELPKLPPPSFAPVPQFPYSTTMAPYSDSALVVPLQGLEFSSPILTSPSTLGSGSANALYLSLSSLVSLTRSKASLRRYVDNRLELELMLHVGHHALFPRQFQPHPTFPLLASNAPDDNPLLTSYAIAPRWFSTCTNCGVLSLRDPAEYYKIDFGKSRAPLHQLSSHKRALCYHGCSHGTKYL